MTGSSSGPDAPPGVDTSAAHIARIQNYLRGGTDNFPADRAAAEQSVGAASYRVYPHIPAARQAQPGCGRLPPTPIMDARTSG